MSGNWFKSPVADWPVVAELLPRPWPIEAVRIDLAYYADQEKMTGSAVPSDRALSERWGWGRQKVRTLIEKIKNRPTRQKIEAENITHEQPTGNPNVTHHETVEAGELPPKKPIDNPPITHEQPTEAFDPNIYNIQTTDTEHITSKEKEKEINKEKENFPAPQAEASVEFETPFSTDEKQSVGLQPCFLTSHTTEGQPPIGDCYKTHDVSVLEPVGYDDIKSDTESTGEANAIKEMASAAVGAAFKMPPEAEATFAVWQEHRKYHTKVGEKPTKMTFSIVKSAYNLLSGDFSERRDSLVLLVEAANICPDKLFSYDIRAEGWDGGTNRSGDLDTIFRHKKIDARLQAAKDWAEKGKIRAGPGAAVQNQHLKKRSGDFVNNLFGEEPVIIDVSAIENQVFQIEVKEDEWQQ